MKASKLLLGLCAGVSVGYTLVRTVQAVREYATPSPELPRDARAYAEYRRALDVAGTIRGLASSYYIAYGAPGRWTDRATRWAPAWLRPALFTVPMVVASSLADLPVSFIESYTPERRYGLSDQSVAAWLEEYVKGTGLSAGFSALVLSLFGIAVRHRPRSWPIVAAAGTLPLLVAMNLVVPLWILPMFNKFVPVNGPLEHRVRALAARFGAATAEILRMDMSRQTRKANAFVTGIGGTHRIVLGDTLIEGFTPEEIEFVVAHELGHYVTKDTWRMIAVSELAAIVLFVWTQRVTPVRDRARLRKRPLLLARFIVTMTFASQVLRPLLLAFSRSREWAADDFALEATNDVTNGAAALARLREQNLADDDPPRWYELFFSSHPALKDRIAKLEAAEAP
jgi:STE24 endopeptidase